MGFLSDIVDRLMGKEKPSPSPYDEEFRHIRPEPEDTLEADDLECEDCGWEAPSEAALVWHQWNHA